MLNEIKAQIIHWTDVLYDEHWEYINCADLDVVHEQYSIGPYPEDGWTHKDIRLLLKFLIDKRIKELSDNENEKGMLGDWYELIEWINDVLSGDDRVVIPIEDNLPDFVSRLFENELDRLRFEIFNRHELLAGEERLSGRLDRFDREAKWLGLLATLRSTDRWNSVHEGNSYSLFLYLVDKFNELYCFS